MLLSVRKRSRSKNSCKEFWA